MMSYHLDERGWKEFIEAVEVNSFVELLVGEALKEVIYEKI